MLVYIGLIQFSLLGHFICIIYTKVLACMLLAYWLFISTYKAHINALFAVAIF